MKADVLDQKGKSIKQIDLDESIFGTEINESVLSQYVYSYLSNQRQSNAHTKDRSEVRGGGKKPHRQKGTGRARSGSNRNPLWTGGGTIFGPTNDRNYKKKITKNFRKAALKSALSSVLKNKSLIIVDAISFKEDKPLTKQASDVKDSVAKEAKKVLIITDGNKETVHYAFSNLKNARVVPSTEMNVYDLLTGGTVIVEENVINTIKDKFSK